MAKFSDHQLADGSTVILKSDFGIQDFGGLTELGPSGLTLSTVNGDTTRAYISNFTSNSVSILDLAEPAQPHFLETIR